ncbi:CAP domain-containing protein [Amycolatopsis sp. DSM 110486]|nr:CAP domain-containing protein [Amycolatopsis sp. DSM 110486]QYN23981.1 CAP domain-containing protein [Amycolatopsis sp. DSM 110486]
MVLVSLSVLLGGFSAAGGTAWLHDRPSVATLSSSATGQSDPLSGVPPVDPYAKQPSSSTPGGTPAAGGAGGTPTSGSTAPTTPTSAGPGPTSTPASGTPGTGTPAPPKPNPKTTPTSTTPARTTNPSMAGQIVDLVNDERAKAGCDPVAEESHLDQAAQDHSDDMSARNYFSHDTPEGKHFDERIRDSGYSKPGAENIAKGATSAKQVMQLWMNSSGHRANILNCSLTKLGVGVTTAGWYWTQDFGY